MKSKFQNLFILLCICSAAFGKPTPEQENPSVCETEECKCHPPPNSTKTQYIVGYGSFIKQSSVWWTDPSAGEIIPVIVEGYLRAWNIQGVAVGYSTTFLGIEEKQNSSFNGVVFPVTHTTENNTDAVIVEEIIGKYDLRETWYCRQRIPTDKLKFLDGIERSDGEYWIYVNIPEYTVKPTKKFPIIQSYVDVFLSGCMEVEDKFKLPGYVTACLRSTENWSKYWVNDRIFPRRAWVKEPKAGKIDKILFAEMPQLFNEIKLE